MKTWQTAGNLEKFKKHFSFKQLLNNFAKVGNNSGIKFLSTLAGKFHPEQQQPLITVDRDVFPLLSILLMIL